MKIQSLSIFFFAVFVVLNGLMLFTYTNYTLGIYLDIPFGLLLLFFWYKEIKKKNYAKWSILSLSIFFLIYYAVLFSVSQNFFEGAMCIISGYIIALQISKIFHI